MNTPQNISYRSNRSSYMTTPQNINSNRKKDLSIQFINVSMSPTKRITDNNKKRVLTIVKQFDISLLSNAYIPTIKKPIKNINKYDFKVKYENVVTSQLPKVQNINTFLEDENLPFNTNKVLNKRNKLNLNLNKNKNDNNDLVINKNDENNKNKEKDEKNDENDKNKNEIKTNENENNSNEYNIKDKTESKEEKINRVSEINKTIINNFNEYSFPGIVNNDKNNKDNDLDISIKVSEEPIIINKNPLIKTDKKRTSIINFDADIPENNPFKYNGNDSDSDSDSKNNINKTKKHKYQIQLDEKYNTGDSYVIKSLTPKKDIKQNANNWFNTDSKLSNTIYTSCIILYIFLIDQGYSKLGIGK